MRVAGRKRRSALLAVFVPLAAAVVVAGKPWSEHETLTPKPEPAPFDSPVIPPQWTVARVWNEALLAAIRQDRPKPPVHARNLFHLSVALWDAWAAYDPLAVGYISTEKHVAADVAAARREAISRAAHRLLVHRFPGGGFDHDGVACQPGAAEALVSFDATLTALGYDPDDSSTVGDSPAAVGNRIGQAVIDHGLADGANEGANLCYPDDTGYVPLNPPLIFKLPGTTGLLEPHRWQPLAFDFLVLQNGIIIGGAVQSFVGVGWGDVTPFALTPADRQQVPPLDCQASPSAQGAPYFDPGCPPQLLEVGDEIVKDAVVELIRFSSFHDPDDPTELDISPAARGNNPLGTDAGTGHPINPVSGSPYPPNFVKRADYSRVVAEFWADGPHSETPPGHWNTLANYVTDSLAPQDKRLGGPCGVLLDDLEWDVMLYLALNGANHDAAIGAWTAKHFYDSSRPITLIRQMGQGQSSDPDGSSYAIDGLPLVPELIEVITDRTIAPGGRHEHLKAFCDVGFNAGLPCEVEADCPDDGPFDGQCIGSVGQIAIRAWLGSPADPTTQVGGVGWRRAVQWETYQAETFVTPPFPGYTSGHSTFSRAAAEMLAAFTGNPYFPGGLGTFVAPQNAFLKFEAGPSQTLELQWATYFDAADEAAISRRYGSIHPYYDDYPARVMGSQIGRKAFAKALQYFQRPPVDCRGDDEDEDEDPDESDDDEGHEALDAGAWVEPPAPGAPSIGRTLARPKIRQAISR